MGVATGSLCVDDVDRALESDVTAVKQNREELTKPYIDKLMAYLHSLCQITHISINLWKKIGSFIKSITVALFVYSAKLE